IKETGKRPTASDSNELINIDRWLRVHHASSLSRWIKKELYNEELSFNDIDTLDALRLAVDTFVSTHRDRPSIARDPQKKRWRN
ncbi:hypothetical protein OE165_27925, partial [Escherichia coli]|uniref:hypothetical protein n=1 Tax=Escherichia coli TaxID=562 RepID=UPI0021F318A9